MFYISIIKNKIYFCNPLQIKNICYNEIEIKRGGRVIENWSGRTWQDGSEHRIKLT